MNETELRDFIKEKIIETEKAVKAREQAQSVWSGGTNKDWRKAGCSLPKSMRLKLSKQQANIAAKKRKELEMFKAIARKLWGGV